MYPRADSQLLDPGLFDLSDCVERDGLLVTPFAAIRGAVGKQFGQDESLIWAPYSDLVSLYNHWDPRYKELGSVIVEAVIWEVEDPELEQMSWIPGSVVINCPESFDLFLEGTANKKFLNKILQKNEGKFSAEEIDSKEGWELAQSMEEPWRDEIEKLVTPIFGWEWLGEKCYYYLDQCEKRGLMKTLLVKDWLGNVAGVNVALVADGYLQDWFFPWDRNKYAEFYLGLWTIMMNVKFAIEKWKVRQYDLASAGYYVKRSYKTLFGGEIKVLKRFSRVSPEESDRFRLELEEYYSSSKKQVNVKNDETPYRTS